MQVLTSELRSTAKVIILYRQYYVYITHVDHINSRKYKYKEDGTFYYF